MPSAKHVTAAVQVAERLRQEIQALAPLPDVARFGVVRDVGDGVTSVSGLPDVRAMELLRFERGAVGVALNLERDRIGAIILGDPASVGVGETVSGEGRILSVPVSEALLGRVVDALGNPVDGRPAVKAPSAYPLERVAPGVMAREPISVPLQTGVVAIDALVPVGRGQRELIIGDRKTGKTALAIDAIVNQRGTGVVNVYVAIGQKESSIARTVAKLEEAGAMSSTVVVVAGASAPASMQYLAPYAGAAIAEYFMDQGKDVLVVYDDLSKHAVAYREVSLLLRRPPGREAYPGDVFYLHSRLLERACRRSAEHGGGSMTALPIIETQAGDISAYVPTNVISITDGQIFLEADLFYKGIRPAINVGLSVSRVGGAAQTKIVKKVAGQLRLDLAQFRELEAFAQFATDLDDVTRRQLERGRRTVELLKQGQSQPLSVAEMAVAIYGVTRGLADAVPADRIREWRDGLVGRLRAEELDLAQAIQAKPALDEAIESGIKRAIAAWNEVFLA